MAVIAAFAAFDTTISVLTRAADKEDISTIAAQIQRFGFFSQESTRASRAEGALVRETVRRETAKLSAQLHDHKQLMERLLEQTAPKSGEVDRESEEWRVEAVTRTIQTEPEAAEEIALGNLDSGFDELERKARTKAADAAQEWRDLAILSENREPQRALRAWREALQIEPNHFWSWIKLARLEYRFDSNLAAAKAALLNAKVLADAPREKLAYFNELATIEYVSGNLAGARECSEQSLSIAFDSLQSNPNDPQAVFDTSILLRRFGSWELDAGNTTGGIEYGQGSVRLLKMLLQYNTQHTDLKRELGRSLSVLGRIQAANNNMEVARDYQAEALQLQKQLLDSSPDRSDVARDVCVSLARLGMYFLEDGESEIAKRHICEGIDLCRAQIQQRPGNSQIIRDLALLLDRQAEIELKQGHFDSARASLVEALEIHKRILSVSPENALSQRDQCIVLNRLGDLEVAVGNPKAARMHYDASLSICKTLFESNAKSVETKRDLIVVLTRLGELTEQRNYWCEAYQIALALYQGGLLAPADHGKLDNLKAKCEGP